jgi:hypothetical protein
LAENNFQDMRFDIDVGVGVHRVRLVGRIGDDLFPLNVTVTLENPS